MNQSITHGLSAPLRALPDMRPRWRNLDCDFDEAANILVEDHKNDGLAQDCPAMDLRTWGFHGQAGLFSLSPLRGQAPPRPLRRTALSNLSTRIGAPADFIKKLPAELQLANLNYLLASHPRPLSTQLRLRGDQITSVVSERYAALDAEEFVETLRGALKEQGVLGDVRVKALASGTTDAMRLVLPDERKELQLGDVSHVGLDVSTSSFGKSAIHISGTVWRLVCENGLRSPESMGRMSLRHVGETSRLREGMRDAVPTALVHARGLMGMWQRAVAAEVRNVGALIDQMRNLTLPERERVQEALKADTGRPEVPETTSVYQLVNAVTQAAHEALPARRLEMEDIGGRLLAQEVA